MLDLSRQEKFYLVETLDGRALEFFVLLQNFGYSRSLCIRHQFYIKDFYDENNWPTMKSIDMREHGMLVDIVTEPWSEGDYI